MNDRLLLNVTPGVPGLLNQDVTENGSKALTDELIAIAMATLRHHDDWVKCIRRQLNAGFDDAFKVNEWLSDKPWSHQEQAKRIRRMERDAKDSDVFVFDYMKMFQALPVESCDAIARAVSHQTFGTRLDKPQLIIR